MALLGRRRLVMLGAGTRPWRSVLGSWWVASAAFPAGKVAALLFPRAWPDQREVGAQQGSGRAPVQAWHSARVLGRLPSFHYMVTAAIPCQLRAVSMAGRGRERR